ncbi:uncharacterized protein LOC129594648 [Paramacrobiotus metropolitanus]|uniref:uncharacterized protein LOC129594648 n=1 Tax=Paramacrobiotus metropolitanus TaxID=2943436 RepID=UPI0024459A61|nr:uncharacterized protein LOC129594648 [Paramacrobiotus metropolitanus]XP_055347377.1 uncharacterized protein LOC129594648 [Paramacrobiotus metropolitanus]XP_055347378.1 uncharacterized protein LOC129594648 [Paramacrobiotus metropolitanus]XP_055347379.1 uncharacterized protein LOC129594648 [Paramacrobiotus metropolitanus]XP_055347380.1 uncharacterized protein LOC129594648 [Paramacrobiotus metropolitanus]XP_055347381.1 uncharacterized protein LOC129594648 [Paramacrobiotus metropolitanus]XP_05
MYAVCKALSSCSIIRNRCTRKVISRLFWIVTLLLFFNFVLSVACPVNSKGGHGITADTFTTMQYYDTNPTETVLRQLDGAVAASGNTGIVVLKNTSEPLHYPPVDIRPTDVVIRVPEGESVSLQCGRKTPGYTLPEVLIRFNGKLLNFTDVKHVDWREAHYHCCRLSSREKQPKAEDIQIIRNEDYNTTGAFQIKLTHLTHAHAGVYECLGTNGTEIVVTKRFVVSPLLFRNQVFQPGMNVSAVVGEPAQLACSVQFNTMSGKLRDFDARFIWRKDKYLMHALGVPSFRKAVIMPPGWNGLISAQIDHSICECHDALMFHDVRPDDAGLYQCFFKIDDVFDEWVVQNIYLHVNML